MSATDRRVAMLRSRSSKLTGSGMLVAAASSTAD
jgi:hypothetical protein